MMPHKSPSQINHLHLLFYPDLLHTLHSQALTISGPETGRPYKFEMEGDMPGTSPKAPATGEALASGVASQPLGS